MITESARSVLPTHTSKMRLMQREVPDLTVSLGTIGPDLHDQAILAARECV